MEGAKETVNVGIEKVGDDRVKRMAMSQALINIYCIDVEKFDSDMRGDINQAFMVMPEKDVSAIIDAYEKRKGKRKERVPLSELGLEAFEGEISEEALFHTCAIVSKANEQYQKVTPSALQGLTLQEFLLKVGKDPAMEISSKVQESLAATFAGLQIQSFGDIRKNVDQLFDGKAIDEVINENKDALITSLAEKYEITEVRTFDKGKKAEFFSIIGQFYGTDTKLDLGLSSYRAMASGMSSSPEVIEAAVDLIDAVQKRAQEVIPDCVKRYDIKRNNEEYNEILAQHLQYDKLYFEDGLQLALLSDGINFGEISSSETVGQAKDLTMIYLILKILKRRDKTTHAHARYLSNIIDLATQGSIDLNININFAPFVPYFQTIFGSLANKVKRDIADDIALAGGLSDLNDDPDMIEKIHNMEWWEFGIEAGKSGVGGGIQIPKELGMTLYKNFGDVMDSETDAIDIGKMVKALGGTIIYSQKDGQNLGLIYLAGKYYFAKPVNILWDTFEAGVTHGAATSVKTYIVGTAPFIVFGGAWGGAAAALKSGIAMDGISILRGTLKG
ncbi:hypothetical protein KKA95_02710, partial [Patescibacteria group bacterium]|nr:hypothetical protein [Patescibacteria group bacterium]